MKWFRGYLYPNLQEIFDRIKRGAEDESVVLLHPADSDALYDYLYNFTKLVDRSVFFMVVFYFVIFTEVLLYISGAISFNF